MRINISVPYDLKARMDAVRNETTNWSKVACRAFEAQLCAIASTKGTKAERRDRDNLIARIKSGVDVVLESVL